MQIEFHNLGKLERGLIDLSKKLIVLTGLNNTGKTYASYAIFGALKIGGFHLEEDIAAIDLNKMHILGQAEPIKENLIRDGFWEISLTEILKNSPELMLEVINGRLASNIKTIFGISSVFSKSSIKCNFDGTEFAKLQIVNTGERYGLYDEGIEISISFPLGKARVEISHAEKISPNEDELEFNIDDNHLNWIAGSILDYIISELLPDVNMLTADRAGMSVFSNEILLYRNKSLNRSNIHSRNNSNSTQEGNVQTRVSKYPFAVNEGLLMFQSEPYDYEVSINTEVINEINDLLGGELKVSEENSLIFTPKNSERQIDIHHSSSMIKSFAGLYFILKYRSYPGSVIIIDEPELNLHPDSQVKVARILIKLVSLGFVIVISTHSDYIIREINAFVAAGNLQSKATKAISAKYQIDPNQIIKPEEIVAYFFDEDGIKNLNVSNFGIQVPSIDTAIQRQNSMLSDFEKYKK